MNLFVELDKVSEAHFARLEKLEPDLAKAAQRALDESAASILQRLRETFREETDPEGKRWIPSKAGKKRKALGTGQTMFDTGTLWNSLQLYASSPDERILGTDVPYGPWLQYHKTVPRVFLSVSDEHEELMEEIFRFRMEEVLNAP
jgi:phage gpG-like protein